MLRRAGVELLSEGEVERGEGGLERDRRARHAESGGCVEVSTKWGTCHEVKRLLRRTGCVDAC